MLRCDLGLASKCLQNAQDYGGVLLLASATGDADALSSLASGSSAGDKNNVAFLSYFMMGKLEECLDLLVKSDRLPEVQIIDMFDILRGIATRREVREHESF